MVKSGISDSSLRESFHVDLLDSALDYFWAMLEFITVHLALSICILQILHYELGPLIDRLEILCSQI